MTTQEIIKAKAMKESNARMLIEIYYNEITHNNKYLFYILAGNNVHKTQVIKRNISVFYIQEIMESIAKLKPLANGCYRYRESYAPGHYNLYIDAKNLAMFQNTIDHYEEQRKLISDAYKSFLKNHDFEQLVDLCNEISKMPVKELVMEDEE